MAGFRIWIGASVADTVTRLSMQMISTMVVARILSAEEFGLATMVLGINTVMAAFIGLPFEESLAQRRRLYTSHLETALFVSALLTMASVALSALFGPMVERLADAPHFTTALIVSSLLLFAQGPGAVARAMARRQRHFVELAICNGLSTTLACLASILAAMAGWGVYALIIQRLLPNVIYPILAAGFQIWRGRRIWLPIRWHGKRFRELFRFSWLHLADVSITNTGPAVLAFLVNGYFGQAALGQLNIALRIVDPLRMALMGVGHNLAFSIMVRLQDQPVRLALRAGEIVAGTGLIIVPAFVGLAVSAPVLLPLLVGPGWGESVPLSQLLCLAVAFALPFRFYYTGYSALGRPEYGLLSSTLALIIMSGIFLSITYIGIRHTAGIAFIAYEITTVVIALILAGLLLGKEIMPSIWRIIRIWAGALIMAGIIHRLYLSGPDITISARQLVVIILTGIIAFPMVMIVICPKCLRDFIQLMHGN